MVLAVYSSWSHQLVDLFIHVRAIGDFPACSVIPWCPRSRRHVHLEGSLVDISDSYPSCEFQM